MSTPGQSLTADELRESVAAILGVEAGSIDDDADLHALGVGSLGMLRLVNRFRRAGLRVSYRQLVREPTLAAWRQHLGDARALSARPAQLDVIAI